VSWVAVTEAVKADQASAAGLGSREQQTSNRTRGVVLVSEICSDPEALESFYREHVEAVQGFIARRVASPEMAADLTADVFLAAIGAAGSYVPGRGTARSWLFGIARHRIADSYRAAAKESLTQSAIVGSSLLDSDDLTRIHERLDAEAEARHLYERLGSVPESERAVLELVALDDLSVAEAAAALGISTVAARVRLHRARARLKPDGRAGRATAGLATRRDIQITEGQA
jgi:RNA polymerase sigma factor (sigma-70 family)